jgi:hypothetical protein
VRAVARGQGGPCGCGSAQESGTIEAYALSDSQARAEEDTQRPPHERTRLEMLFSKSFPAHQRQVALESLALELRTPANVIESEGSRRNTVEGDLDSVECERALDSGESSGKAGVRRRRVGKRTDRGGSIEERDCDELAVGRPERGRRRRVGLRTEERPDFERIHRADPEPHDPIRPAPEKRQVTSVARQAEISRHRSARRLSWRFTSFTGSRRRRRGCSGGSAPRPRGLFRSAPFYAGTGAGKGVTAGRAMPAAA